MKCDRFIGTGRNTDGCLRATSSNTGSSQNAEAGYRFHSSKQRKRTVHKKDNNVITRSKTFDFSRNVPLRGIPVSIVINSADKFPEIYTYKQEQEVLQQKEIF